jgi:hypothetical protein
MLPYDAKDDGYGSDAMMSCQAPPLLLLAMQVPAAKLTCSAARLHTRMQSLLTPAAVSVDPCRAVTILQTSVVYMCFRHHVI